MTTRGGWWGIVDISRRAATGWLRHLPWLIAIYLVGWLLRYGLVTIALAVGHRFGDLWSYLVTPLAILVQIFAYIAMFLVLRPARPTGEEGGVRALMNAVFTMILPIFVLFAAWKLVRQDDLQMDLRIGEAAIHAEGAPHEVTGWVVYAAIAVAFSVRYLLTKFRDRLPTWTQLFAMYFEATWLLLVAHTAALKLFASPQWIRERRISVWYHEQRTEVLARLHAIAHLYDWADWVTANIVPAVLLALTWIAVAGVIHGSSSEATWAGASRQMLGQRAGERVSTAGQSVAQRTGEKLSRAPRLVHVWGTEIWSNLVGVAEKLSGTIRMVMHSGPLTVAFYVTAFMATVWLCPFGAYFDPYVSDGHLWRFVAWLIGPHAPTWWAVYAEPIRTGLNATVDTFRIALVSAMYFHCADRVQQAAVTATAD